MESILVSIKKMLMIAQEDTSFDADITMHINSVLSVLNQLGVGPEDGFCIHGEAETWEDLLGEYKNLDAVRSYVYLKVKMLFDPPVSGAVSDSMNRVISELEWRINVTAEAAKKKKGKEGLA